MLGDEGFPFRSDFSSLFCFLKKKVYDDDLIY